MSQVRTDYDRTARIVFANLNFFITARRLEEDQLRAAAGSMPPRLLQTQHVSVECNRLVQISHPIARMKQLLDHC